MPSSKTLHDAPTSPHAQFPPQGNEFDVFEPRHRVLNTAFGEIPLTRQTFFRRSWIKWYLLLVILIVCVILLTVYHDPIVRWLQPPADKVANFPGGWAIIIVVIFILSFPPLFGAEFVGILCGLIYGLWVGFAIFSAGTLLGEIGNFYAFRYLFTNRARKLEEDDVNFACMTRIVEEGGFKVVLLARLSAVPGHLTTAVFATTRMGFWPFTIACILTLPKQLTVVYLGAVFDKEPEEKESLTSKIVSYGVLILGTIVTIWACWYLYREMGRIRPIVLEARKLRDREAGLATGEAGDIEPTEKASLSPSRARGPSYGRRHGADSAESLVNHAELPAGYRQRDYELPLYQNDSTADLAYARPRPA